jgi:hypothetical protein
VKQGDEEFDGGVMKQTGTKATAPISFEVNAAYEALALEYTAARAAFAQKYARVQLISLIAYLRAKAKHAQRCNPPLAEAEVAQIAASITGRYSRGVPIQVGGAT